MEKQRRKYTPEFKEEIVKLITEQGKTVTEVSRDIEVHAGVIRRWVKTYTEEGLKGFPGKGRLRQEDAEYKAFQKCLCRILLCYLKKRTDSWEEVQNTG